MRRAPRARAWARGLLAASLGAGAGWACAQTAPLTLAAVERALDAAAPRINAVSAQAEVTYYTALVQDSDHSRGRFYFKRTRHGPMYVLDLTEPAESAKRMVFRDHTGWLYTAASHEVEKADVGSKKNLLNLFLSLGIGASSQALENEFAISDDGPVTLDGGTATVKLTLKPRHPEVFPTITQIEVWYDTGTWVAAQWQIYYVGGDYDRVRYRGIEINPKLDDKLFSTDFPGATLIQH